MASRYFISLLSLPSQFLSWENPGGSLKSFKPYQFGSSVFQPCHLPEPIVLHPSLSTGLRGCVRAERGVHTKGLHDNCSPASLLAGSLANTMSLFSFFLLGWKVVTIVMPGGPQAFPVNSWENRESLWEGRKEGRACVVL